MAQRTRWAWLRSYVRHRVDEKLEPGALERALGELHAGPGDDAPTRTDPA